jgi:hypothetical protein
MRHNHTPAATLPAPLDILSPMALFERQCVASGVDADARALRAMLHDFFTAGMEAGKREATRPVRHPVNPDQFAHASTSSRAPAPDSAFADLGLIGFDPHRVQAALERAATTHAGAPADVDAVLREAVRRLIVVRGRMVTEINYKGVVDAYDTAVRVHGAPGA